MWRDYVSGYLKNNRASALSVMAAAFISALLLSLLCGLSYNLWKYEVERIEMEEGDWHSRIAGAIDEEMLRTAENFAHVGRAAVNETESAAGETAVDLYFDDLRAVLPNTPKIAEMLGIPREKITYHHGLLAVPDPAPRLLLPLFLLITALSSFSLIMIIHNSFAVTMNARIHQFGIFSSIGATPRQIRVCLLEEAAALCAGPVIGGNLLGIAGSMGMIKLTNVFLGSDIPGRHEAVFGYHPLMLLFSLLVTVLTIWLSAWMPARRLSRLTPLEAIRSAGEPQLRRRKSSRVLAFLFGVEGEIAGNALKAQRKALRTASLSLIVSFLAFAMMQCFFTLSAISVRETYFERNQDVWDIMTTVKNVQIDTFEEPGRIGAAAETGQADLISEMEQIRRLPGVKSAAAYQRAAAKRIIAEEELSSEARSFDGLEGGLVSAPLVILDDVSFEDYLRQIGVAPRLDGAVILNRIRDVANPDFRHPQFFPYLNGESGETVLRQSGNEASSAEIPVIAYTDQTPVLREEYATIDYYELVHFLPASLWKEIKGQIGGAEADLDIRVLCEKDPRETDEAAFGEELVRIQDEIERILSPRYQILSENRIQEKQVNDRQIAGMKVFFGGFCALLALIGIGSVFSNALGFVRQRRREFARYMSVGLTPRNIRKIFVIEALAIAGRPVLTALPAVAAAVALMLRASYMEPREFLAEAPIVPVGIFLLAILLPVALAYYLGWRGVRQISLAEVLKDDALL